MESLGKSVSHAADPSTSSGEDKGLSACVWWGCCFYKEASILPTRYTPCPEGEVLILRNCSWKPILTLQDKAKEGFEDVALSDKSLEISPCLSPGTRAWPVHFLLAIWSFGSLITIVCSLCSDLGNGSQACSPWVRDEDSRCQEGRPLSFSMS